MAVLRPYVPDRWCYEKRNLWIASAAMAWQALGAAQTAEPPALAAFATGDGAYYSTLGGQVVDPYFINKGFIIALQADAPLQTELQQWLAWLLPRQRKDGGFDRFCPTADKAWRNCMGADADDSMAATTIEMLHYATQKMADQRAAGGGPASSCTQRATACAPAQPQEPALQSLAGHRTVLPDGQHRGL